MTNDLGLRAAAIVFGLSSFLHSWAGIENLRGSAVGIIQIGPTVQKLSVETCFPIEMADLEIPAKHVHLRCKAEKRSYNSM